MRNDSQGTHNSKQDYQSAINMIADQLCLAVDGQFDLLVKIESADETVQKLSMLTNFVIDSARRALKSSIATNKQLSQEVEQRKVAEKTLRESESRYRMLTSISPVGIFKLDTDLRFTFANDRLSDICGLSREEIMTHGWESALYDDESKKIQRKLTQFIKHAQKKQFKTEIRFVRSDHDFASVLMDVVKECDQNDICRALIGTITDISKLRKMEDELHERQNELAHFSRLKMANEMVTSIAHEVNQPLAAVVQYLGGCIARIKPGSIHKEIMEMLERALHQAERAGDIIHHFKDFLQKGVATKTIVDVKEMIADLLPLVQSDITKHQIKLQISIPESGATISADKIQIEQALLNLLQNAIEAIIDSSPKSRIISINTNNTDSEKICINVVNTGAPIQQEDLLKIFNPFHTTKKNGMGMGLAITRAIIEANDGRITVKNMEMSVNFCMQFPILKIA